MMTRLIPQILVLALAGVSAPLPAPAAPDPWPDEPRYSFSRAGEGYLRLDSATGQVSFCVRRPAGWVCQAAADERAALEAEIARLQAETVTLKRELLARNLPLPGLVRRELPAAEPSLTAAHNGDLSRVMAFIERAWWRLVDLFASAQRELMKKS